MVLVGEGLFADVVEAELAAVRPVEAKTMEADSLSQSVDQHIGGILMPLKGLCRRQAAYVSCEVEYP